MKLLNFVIFLLFFYWSIGGGTLSASGKPEYIFLNHLIFFLILFFSLLKIYINGKINFTSKIEIPVFFLFLSVFLSTYFSKYQRISLEEFSQIILYILLFFSVINYPDSKSILKIMVFVGVIISLIGIFQYIFFKGNVRQIYSTLENPNIFAGYLILITFLSLIFYERKIYRFYLFIFLISIFLSFSRAGYISSIVGIFLFYGLSKNLFKKWWFYISGLMLIVLIFTSTFFYFERAKPSIQERILIYKSTFRMIRESPILIGNGISTFSVIYPKYIYNQYIPGVGYNRFHSHSHSTYLNIFYEGGIFYLFSFLFFLITILKILIKNRNNFNNALLTSIISFLTFSTFDYLLNIFVINLIFWTILAIAVRYNVKSFKEIKIDRKILILFFPVFFLLFSRIFFIDFAHFYFKKGVYSADNNRFLQAEKYFKKAINLDKNFSVYHSNLAIVYQNLYKFSRNKKFKNLAEKEIKISERLNPYQKFTYKRSFKISSSHLEFILYKRYGIKDEKRF